MLDRRGKRLMSAPRIEGTKQTYGVDKSVVETQWDFKVDCGFFLYNLI